MFWSKRRSNEMKYALERKMKAILQKSGGGVGGRRQRNDFIFRTRRRRIRWKKRVVRQNQSSGPPKAIRTFWVAIQSTIKPIKAHVLSAWSFPNSNVPCVHVLVQNCARILSYPQFLTCQWLSITLHHRPYLSVTQRHLNAPENLLWASAEFWPAKLLWTSAEFWQQTRESRQKQFRHSIQTVRNMDNVAVRQHGDERTYLRTLQKREAHTAALSQLVCIQKFQQSTWPKTCIPGTAPSCQLWTEQIASEKIGRKTITAFWIHEHMQGFVHASQRRLLTGHTQLEI